MLGPRRRFRYLVCSKDRRIHVLMAIVMAVISLSLNNTRTLFSQMRTITQQQQSAQHSNGSSQPMSKITSTPLLKSLDSTGIPMSGELQADNNIEDWWIPFVNETARTFPAWKGRPLDFCLLEKDQKWMAPDMAANGETVNGMLYVKMPKSSSSTGAGIHLAMAHRVAQRKLLLDSNHTNTAFTSTNNDVVCHNYNRHEFADAKQHGRRQHPSLLWTIVRDPRARDTSHIGYFQLSFLSSQEQQNVKPQQLKNMLLNQFGKQTAYLYPTRVNVVKMENELRSTTTNSYQENEEKKEPQQQGRRRLAARKLPIDPAQNPKLVSLAVGKIFESYDFIGVTERLEESKAVMTLLWGLEAADVITLSENAKKSGSYCTRKRFNQTCIKIQKPSQKILDVLQSDKLLYNRRDYTNHQADFLLYATAQESLDRTIQSLGVDVVQARMQQIRELQDLVTKKCFDSAIYPCSSTGVYQIEKSRTNCYMEDSGCGYPCVDRVLQEHASNML